MPRVLHHLGLLALLLGAASNLPAQLIRAANTTIAELPNPATYTVENLFTPTNLTFTEPVEVKNAPGVTDSVFVVGKRGVVHRVNLETHVRTTFLDLSAFLSGGPVSSGSGTNPFTTGFPDPLLIDSESGLLGIAFHPDYETNGLFFITFTNTQSDGANWMLARFKASGTGNYAAAMSTDLGSYQPLIKQRDEAPNHNGGAICFGPDGYLYVSTGDEGGSNDQYNNSRFINMDFFSCILRLDVDVNLIRNPPSLEPQAFITGSVNTGGNPSSRARTGAFFAGSYKIPADNPFIGATAWNNGGLASGQSGYRSFNTNTVRTEIWATGFRNPWRMSFDAATGWLFVSDVGQGAREEVNIVEKGRDYGWAYREGLNSFSAANVPPAPNSPTPYYPGTGHPHPPADPVHDYDRNTGQSITGGYVYHGSRLPELQDKYIFADYASNRVWALEEDDEGDWTRSDLATVNGVGGFGIDPRNGDILMCRVAFGQVNGGTVVRLVRNLQGSTQLPATLGATGVFSNTANLTVHAGIVPYEPNVSFWSDRAVKRRWFSIPNVNSDMVYSRDGNWTFPSGTYFIKHFEVPIWTGSAMSTRRVETRILVKNGDTFFGMTYRWRTVNPGAQTEADLVAAAGQNESITVRVGGATGSNVTQNWRYPSRSECISCHTPAAGGALSFNTRQINRNFTYGSQVQNQLSALDAAGYFTASPAAVQDVHTLPALATAGDTTKSLEWRARSYLDANCSQCHRPGGGGVGYWDARATTPTSQAGIIDGLLVNVGNNAQYRVTRPGNISLSMLLDRIRNLNPTSGTAHMPPIPSTSSQVVDTEGADLIQAWIVNEMPGHQTYAQWQAAQFAPTPGPESAPDQDPDGDGQTNQQEFLARTDPRAATVPNPPDVLVDTVNNLLSVSFDRVFNRALVIETSPDLDSWARWNIPGNQPEYSATGQGPKTLSVPLNTAGDNKYFRVRMEEL